MKRSRNTCAKAMVPHKWPKFDRCPKIGRLLDAVHRLPAIMPPMPPPPPPQLIIARHVYIAQAVITVEAIKIDIDHRRISTADCTALKEISIIWGAFFSWMIVIVVYFSVTFVCLYLSVLLNHPNKSIDLWWLRNWNVRWTVWMNWKRRSFEWYTIFREQYRVKRQWIWIAQYESCTHNLCKIFGNLIRILSNRKSHWKSCF